MSEIGPPHFESIEIKRAAEFPNMAYHGHLSRKEDEWKLPVLEETRSAGAASFLLIRPAEILSFSRKRRLLKVSIAFVAFAVAFIILLLKSNQAKSPRKALILSSHKAQDTSWLKDIPSDWAIYLYETDNVESTLTIPREQGREAMTYITFLIDHYTELPDYAVFLHGHNRSWHQPQSIVAKIKALNLTVVAQEGFASLRCWQFPACTPDSYVNMSAPERDPIRLTKLTPAFFEYAFRNEADLKMPDVFGTPCCAQFAVTKTAIRTRSLEFWKRLRQPMLEDGMKAYANGTEDLDDWHVGALFEHTWHYFFGKAAVECPTERHCREVLFSNKVHCDSKGSAFSESMAFFDNPDNVRCWYGDS